MKYFKSFPIELFFWTTALVLLATSNAHEHHFTLCPLANLGYEGWCPGCGLGRSITQLLNGNIEASLAHHWFGIPALFIILLRVWALLRMEFKRFKKA